MKWYIIYVQSGREQNISEQLDKMGYRTLCPTEKRLIRQGGQWREKEYILFQGYVFVRLAYSFPVYYKISKIKGVIKLLGGGKNPTAVSESEMKHIKALSALCTDISTVRFENGTIVPMSGALHLLENHIVKVDRRQRRAIAEIKLADKLHKLTLSFIEQTPQAVSG